MGRPILLLKRGVAPLFLAALLAWTPAVEEAAGKGLGITAASRGVELPGSPYRYTTLNPGLDVRMPTIVLRIDRENGRVDRWWRLRGRYFLPATAYDFGGSGLSRDGRTLVLQRFTMAYPPRRSRFAVLDTAVHLSHPLRPGQERPHHAVRRIEIPGFYSLHAISPDGTTAYLNRYLPQRRTIAKFELRALDLESGRLLPGAVEPAEEVHGTPITQAVSPDRRWAYTLYDGNIYGKDDKSPFLLALDTTDGRVRKVELPQLREPRTLFLTRMRFAAGGSKLVVFRRSPAQRPPTPPLLTIDTETLEVSDVGAAMAALGRRLMAALAAALPSGEEPFLAFARTPRRPGNLLARIKTVGRSPSGRPITLKQVGDPKWSGELLVLDSEVEPLTGGCPDPSADIYLVPELHSKMRLAKRISRALKPEETIWFRRESGRRPAVRGEGQGTSAARRFAAFADLPFRPLSGSRGEGSFVVELPRGRLDPAMESRLSRALVWMGRWVRED